MNRWRTIGFTMTGRRPLAMATALLAVGVMIGLGGVAGATTIGPGVGITDGDESLGVDTPGGDRLNVDRTTLVNLAAGTYTIRDFGLNVLTHNAPAGGGGAGTITPMLLAGMPSNYTTLWVGSPLDPTANGIQAVDYTGDPTAQFTLAAAADVRAGFFTQGLGSDIIGLDSDNTGALNSSSTDHDVAFTIPTGAGQAVDSFNGIQHQGLGRTYSFEINVLDAGNNAAMVGPGAGIIDGGLVVDTPNEDRLNVDRTNFANLPPGTYNVDDFGLRVLKPNAGVGGAGTITPMLLTGMPSNYQAVWLGPAYDPSTYGIQTVAYSGQQFTLDVAADVRVGFFTQNEGSAILALDDNNSGSGSSKTDHYGSGFPVPTVPGDMVNGFSNPDLGRTYAFEVNVSSADVATVSTNVVIGLESDIAPDGPVANTAYTPAFASGGPSASDLLNGLSPIAQSGNFTLEGGGGTPALTDGAFDTFYGTPGVANTNHGAYATAGNGGGLGTTVTYDLGAAYDLSAVVIYGGWLDGGRDQQNAEVLVSFDNVNFSSVASTTGNLDTVASTTPGSSRPLSHRNSFLDGGGGDLASNVRYIKVNFNAVENGYAGYAEIDAFGVVVPEPSTLALSAFGLLGLLLIGRRRRS